MSNRRRPLYMPDRRLALPVTRRRVLGGMSAGALALASGGVLSACGTEGASQTEASCDSGDLSAEEKDVIWSNWPAYIDPIQQDDSTLSQFEQQSGISVEYNDDVNDNSDFYGK